MIKKFFKNLDYKLIIIVLVLASIGCVALFSAASGDIHGSEFIKQLTWIGVGVVLMLITSMIDYQIYQRYWPVLYVISIILLIGVLFMPPVNGATSWYNLGFMSFQPSELAKICVIISIAAVISKIQIRDENGISKIKNLILVLGLLLVPVVLIVLQPDYGTAMTFIVFTLVMLFIANIDKKYILFGALAVIVALPLLYMFVLPQHAKDRIDVFLDPTIDPLGKGYNIIQSKIAIGSGQLTGMGIGEGNQTQLGYLYPKTTDFIFAVIGEEMGFIVAGIVIIFSMWLLLRCIYISKTAKDHYGALLAIGIMGMFMFYIVENIGMTMGLLPITGVPLPFVSYGGSSMICNMIAIGILLNICSQKEKIVLLGR